MVATYHNQFVKIRHTIPSSLGKKTCSERHDKVARGIISLVKEHALRGQIEEALAQFSKDPLSEESRKAGALIVSYAEASKIVSIVISPETLPMLASEDKALGEKHGTQMLMAYIAGCVRAQLKNGAVDSYPGVVEQLKVYKLLRKNGEIEQPLEVYEEWLKMKQDGTLEKHIASLDEGENEEDD